MSKLFTYLNIKEGDLGLIDGETQQMAQVVDMMQGAYKNAPDGRKKEVLANMISETVALVLARLNAIDGLSKEEEKYPFKVGEKWLSKLSNIVFKIIKINEKDGEILVENIEEVGSRGRLKINIIIEMINDGNLIKVVDEEMPSQEEEPKEEEEEKQDEFKVGDKFYAKEEKESGVDMNYEVNFIDGEKFIFVSFDGKGKLYTYENIPTSEANELLRKGSWIKIEEKTDEPPIIEEVITEGVGEAEPTKEEILETIAALELLAEAGNEAAQETIDALKLLI